MNTKNTSGMTLIELMVTVAIVAILASIALPSYTSYIRRTHRTDATAALLRLAAAQEKFYIQNNTYATTPAAVGVANTENGWYTLSISGASASDFTATATAPATSGQYNDTDCRTFSINAAGMRSATSAGGAVTTATCWR